MCRDEIQSGASSPPSFSPSSRPRRLCSPTTRRVRVRLLPRLVARRGDSPSAPTGTHSPPQSKSKVAANPSRSSRKELVSSLTLDLSHSSIRCSFDSSELLLLSATRLVPKAVRERNVSSMCRGRRAELANRSESSWSCSSAWAWATAWA